MASSCYLISTHAGINTVKRAHVLYIQLLQQSQGLGPGEDLKIVGHKVLAIALHITIMSHDVQCNVVRRVHHLALRCHLLLVARALGSISGNNKHPQLSLVSTL